MERCLARRRQRNRRRQFRHRHRRQACWTGQEESITEVRWGRCGRGETCGALGKLAMLTQEAQSERPRKRRQSGVVDLDGNLGPDLY
jgi:hypothetical protein